MCLCATSGHQPELVQSGFGAQLNSFLPSLSRPPPSHSLRLDSNPILHPIMHLYSYEHASPTHFRFFRLLHRPCRRWLNADLLPLLSSLLSIPPCQDDWDASSASESEKAPTPVVAPTKKKGTLKAKLAEKEKALKERAVSSISSSSFPLHKQLH